ncbi:MAG: tetratricopeptide repeat protein [Polyangia bacterium]
MWLALASAARLAGGLPAAHAQSGASPEASALVEQARDARARGRLAEAIDAYSRAYLEGGDPEILFELGECQRAAGREADASRSFQNYLRRAPRGPHHRRAEEQVNELQAAASRAPSTAGATPAKPSLAVPLVAPAQAATPTAPAMVSPPTAVATSGATFSPVAVGLTTVAAPAAPAGPPLPRWVPWSLAATTVVLAGVAAWAGWAANDRFDELQQSCGQTTGGCDADATRDLKDRARRANILWALTGVAAVGTGVTIYANTSAAGLSGLWRY